MNMPLLPRSNKSVVSSILDREPGLMPQYQWDIQDPLTCVEVIFGSGDIFRTGSAGGPSTVVQSLMVVKELSIKSSLAYGGEEVEKCLYYLSFGRFNTRGLFSGSIPLSDPVEKGFDRLAFDKSLIKVAVAP